jgi:hypothetical protein
MPHYEYRCAANGRTVEVRHPMTQHFETWGEVAGAAGLDVGDTPADAPVERLMSVSAVGAHSESSCCETPSGRSGGGCCGGCACAHGH